MWRSSFLFLCSCSLFAKNIPICGDGVKDPGEVCYQQIDIDSDRAPGILSSFELNQDGIPDFISTNAAGTLTAFTGDGKGGFDLLLRLSFATAPIGFTVQDFDGNNQLDLAVVRLGALFNQDPGFLDVFLADAAGAFPAQPLEIQIGIQPQLLLPGDFNGDGLLDLVVTEFNSFDVLVLLNDPLNPNRFTAQTPIGLNAVESALAVGDIDGDQDLDLVTGDVFQTDLSTFNNQLSVLTNNGAATFSVQKLNTGFAPGGVELADIDGDQDLDILSANVISDDIGIFENEGGGTFAAPEFLTVGNGPQTVLARDVDDDGDLDLAVAENDFDKNTGVLRILLNEDGTFTDKGSIDLGGLTQPFAAEDFNGDGLLDFAISDNNLDQYNILLSTN